MVSTGGHLRCHYRFYDGTRCIYMFGHEGNNHENEKGTFSPNGIKVIRRVIQ